MSAPTPSTWASWFHPTTFSHRQSQILHFYPQLIKKESGSLPKKGSILLEYWILNWPIDHRKGSPKFVSETSARCNRHPHASWLSPHPRQETLNHFTGCLQLTSLTQYLPEIPWNLAQECHSNKQTSHRKLKLNCSEDVHFSIACFEHQHGREQLGQQQKAD